MNKLIIVGILVIGFFIFPSVTEENDSIEGRLEIISPTKCINLENKVDDCEKQLALNSQNEICNVENSYLFNFEKNTIIEFFTVELESSTKNVIKYKYNDNETIELKYVTDLVWVDIGEYVESIHIYLINICNLQNLHFYGRV